MRKLILWTAEHPTLTVSLIFLAVFLLLNLLAYRHARTMTHFAPAHPRARTAESCARQVRATELACEGATRRQRRGD